jgi:hypothetical protein
MKVMWAVVLNCSLHTGEWTDEAWFSIIDSLRILCADHKLLSLMSKQCAYHATLCIRWTGSLWVPWDASASRVDRPPLLDSVSVRRLYLFLSQQLLMISLLSLTI